MSPRCEAPRGLRQWEVVLLEFPFSDSSKKKLRPVLVLSNSDFNRISNSVVVCQITSNLSSGFREYNVFIEPSDVCLYGDAFMRPSLVKPYMVFSVSKREVHFKVGVLSEEKADEVRERLRKLFDYRVFTVEQGK
ncbi:type II toxin-antitoxin system PemK/MazF family toxin [Thermococcus sp.]|uniref:type II toxin-antitoxin system PemK/MazF family toxin n=1 Tax=Thermococcus sp. TaxID=35749 RepID=UPI002606CD20|nr:type II toxin-antitoxin system PemK/MazF family toxin [Thermococcus sp.]